MPSTEVIYKTVARDMAKNSLCVRIEDQPFIFYILIIKS